MVDTKIKNYMLTVVTDRKFNLLSETIEETDKEIDWPPAAMVFADEFHKWHESQLEHKKSQP